MVMEVGMVVVQVTAVDGVVVKATVAVGTDAWMVVWAMGSVITVANIARPLVQCVQDLPVEGIPVALLMAAEVGYEVSLTHLTNLAGGYGRRY